MLITAVAAGPPDHPAQGARPVLDSGAQVESPMVVRVAGVPAAALDPLRCDATLAQVDELLRLRAWLRDEGAALSALLYPVIGALPAGADRPALVGLRRAVHQLRKPNAREWNQQVAAVLPAEVADRVRRWVAQLAAWEARRNGLDGTLAAEARRTQAALRDLVGRHPGFLRALSQASPPLFAEVAKWLADDTHRPRQQSLARLAKFLARAATKTSPYSTFTVSGAGVWTDHGPAVAPPGRATVTGVMELNGLLLTYLSRSLGEHPRLSSALRLRVNPSATLQDGTVAFIGVKPGEPIVTVPATPAVRACLDALGGGELTLDALRDRLAPDTGDRGRVEEFLRGLVGAGLLERRLPVADQADDYLGDLIGCLTGHDAGDLADVAALARRVHAQLHREVAVADVDGHLSRQDALAGAVDDLGVRFGFPPGSVAGRERGLFHETSVFTGGAFTCSARRWRPALEDLDAVRRWLAVFDPALPIRLALGAYCRQRFGAGARVPFLTLHRAVHEEVSRAGAPAQTGAAHEVGRLLQTAPLASAGMLAGSQLPRLRELGGLQRQARRAALAPTGADGHVRTDAGALRRVAATWPAWVPPPGPLAFYLQITGDDGGDDGAISVVLNAAHTGYGRGRSRVLRLVGRAGGPARTHDSPLPATQGPMLAELCGLFGSTLNLRAPAAASEIDYPFVVSARPDTERIPLRDLEVVHDPRTDLARLVCAPTGRGVRPLHLGMMADVLLPPAARLLVHGFGPAHQVDPSVPLLTPPPGPPSPPGPRRAIVAVPRVQVGRVCVQRARWVAPTDAVPAREKGEPDASYLLRLVGWLRGHGIPTRSFVRMWALDPGAANPPSPGWDQRFFDKSRKPVYIDVRVWPLVLTFERMLRRAGPVVVFEEALPAPEAAAGPDPDHPAVTEFLVELSGDTPR